MSGKSTVRSVTFDLLRSLGLTTVFGNPGSTEQTFLQEFPADFTYVLALQEASAIAMADTFAQVTRRPAVVNLHSSAGLGNAMGNLVAAYHGSTPLIVTSGQQHRELVIGDPYLGNREATTMPKPWVKWSYEPARAQDVPEAFMRACTFPVTTSRQARNCCRSPPAPRPPRPPGQATASSATPRRRSTGSLSWSRRAQGGRHPSRWPARGCFRRCRAARSRRRRSTRC